MPGEAGGSESAAYVVKGVEDTQRLVGKTGLEVDAIFEYVR